MYIIIIHKLDQSYTTTINYEVGPSLVNIATAISRGY